MPDDERRINIRVKNDIFDLWDDRRHAQRRSWQELGMDLFSRWYKEEAAPPKSIESSAAADFSRVPLELRPVIEKCVLILAGRDQQLTEAMVLNVHLFYRMLRDESAGNRAG